MPKLYTYIVIKTKFIFHIGKQKDFQIQDFTLTIHFTMYMHKTTKANVENIIRWAKNQMYQRMAKIHSHACNQESELLVHISLFLPEQSLFRSCGECGVCSQFREPSARVYLIARKPKCATLYYVELPHTHTHLLAYIHINQIVCAVRDAGAAGRIFRTEVMKEQICVDKFELTIPGIEWRLPKVN